MDIMDKWYQLSAEQCFAELDCSETGLTDEEAAKRLQKYGYNELAFKRPGALIRFLRQFNNALVYILLSAAAITGVLTANGHDMLADTLVIVSVVVLNAILGFFQEGKAENALLALQNMMVAESSVLRNGEQVTVPAREIVPGDVVVLNGGDKIPADVRLFFCKDVRVDEAALTGESLPVGKSIKPVSTPGIPPGDQNCMGFSGTFLVNGAAKALVTGTGKNTEFGKIASLMKKTEQVQTPLQRKITEFTQTLIISILVVGGINFVLGSFVGYSIVYSFLASVSLIVAAIPEMLPMIVTAILAFSSSTMAKRNALIRRLPAAETLGCTSVICSDKTGTLTRNEMTVVKIYAGNIKYTISGVGYEPLGRLSEEGKAVEGLTPALRETFTAGLWCNDAKLQQRDGRWQVLGDPTEGALIVSADKNEEIRQSPGLLDEIPFDSGRMYMATLHPGEGENIVYVKGSPEMVLKHCRTQLLGDTEVALDREPVLQRVEEMATSALRVLAMAGKRVPAEHTALNDEDMNNLCFYGLQGMIDPPRAEAIVAVEKCKQAGIRPVMITGDHSLTAQSVAILLGIIGDYKQKVLIGEQLSQMTDDDLYKVVEDVSVYARVAPEHKLQVVQQLQRHGHVTAITGDGVNDAPALKAADIGIAMGVTGTEVSKEAAGMVLTDDNFATIVGAVEEGRHAWNNLEKAILYTLPTNGGQALLVMGAILLAPLIPLFGIRLPLEPVQILWVNLFDSVFLTMPLMMEPKGPHLLTEPPRNPHAKIANALFFQRVILMGLAIAVPTFFVYHHFGAAAVVDGVLVDPFLLTQAQTAAFWAVLLVHFGFVMSARSVYDSAFSFSPFSNPWLLGGILVSILIRLLPTFVPAFAEVFRTAEFPLDWWWVILPCLLPGFVALEIDKWLRRRCFRKTGGNTVQL